MGSLFLSVIIPAFNEEARIIPTLEKITAYLSLQPYSWEVVVVDDGSSDRTPQLVADRIKAHEGVRLLTVPHAGKGWAIRHGMLASHGKYKFMCDADLAMPIERLAEFIERMDEGHDIVIGSRQVAGARRFNEPVIRHAMGRVFNRCVRLLAVGAFQDTQCGFKCFRSEVTDELFEAQRTRGFGFDVEILYLALKRGLQVLEIPIDWYHQKATKLRPLVDSSLMLRDAIVVRGRDLRGEYAIPAEEAKPTTAPGVSSQEEAKEARERSDGLVVVVVPTYNEAENLPELADRIFAMNLPNVRVIVVDDGSPDGTAQVAEELADRFDGRVELIKRSSKQGLGTAYVQGFSHALSVGADYVVQIDADLSHPPEHIPEFLKALRGADVVVGSRYVPGGGLDRRSGLARRLLSYLANQGIRGVTGLKVKDATSGFKAFRREALSSLDLHGFKCKGFGLQSEVAHACQRRGHTVVERPIVFVDRERGRSKMSLLIALEAIWRLLLVRWRR